MDEFGARMKEYESKDSVRLGSQTPIIVRLDGKGFSRYTSNFEKPYDKMFSDIMIEVTRQLVDYTNALVGYTQSDEISLILFQDGKDIYFGGKVQKIVSTLASFASAIFAREIVNHPKYDWHEVAVFDARVFSVPDKMEATNVIYWRMIDAYKNSINSLASCHFTPKQLFGVSQEDRIKMLEDINVFHCAYPPIFKYGTLLRKVEKLVKLSDESLSLIPERFRPKDGIVNKNIEELYNIGENLDMMKFMSFIFDKTDELY